MAAQPTPINEGQPKLTYRTRRQFELREADFGKSSNKEIADWVYEQLDARRKQLRNLHTNKVPEWRRIASGRPREENKSWPFENCSNLVHQIAGESRDELSARVIALIWNVAPVINFSYFTASKAQKDAEHNARKARTLMSFIDYVAYEPKELDLYRVENLWFADSTDLGTAFACVIPEKCVEAVYIGYDKKKSKTEMEDVTLYEGPKVLNLRFEDVTCDPDANTLEDSVFVSRKLTLNRRDLHERVFKKFYRKADVEKILGKPDRYGPGEIKKRENQKKGITDSEDRILAEWEIEECYFYWYVGEKKYRLILWYHFETKTVLNQVFNFIPDNQIPIVRTRLTMGEHGMYGRGFADMLEHSQDEISTAKNQRNDATLWMMMGINRLSPQNRNIDRNIKSFPGAMMPFNKDEFEHYDVGNVAAGQLSLQNEQAMIQQARERAGVGPPITALGAGGTNKKGQYGSMGTMAVMQESNSRNAHRTSDFRHSHVKLISLLTDMYGAMGLGAKGSLFGLDDKLLEEALSDYLERRVRIPIRAATASANKEVTKQNEILLSQALANYTKEMTTLLQATVNASMPPHVKQWLIETAKGRVMLFQNIIRDFQLSDQPEEYVPNINFPEEGNDGNQSQGPAQPTGLDPRIAQMAQLIQQPRSSAVPGGQPGMEQALVGPGRTPSGVGI